MMAFAQLEFRLSEKERKRALGTMRNATDIGRDCAELGTSEPCSWLAKSTNGHCW